MAKKELPKSFVEQEMPELRRVERRRQVWEILNQHNSIAGSERMLLRKMSKVMLQSNPEVAHNLWTKIKPQTLAQETALGIHVENFDQLHSHVQDYLAGDGSDKTLAVAITRNLTKENPKGPGYEWNDRHEISQKPGKNLEKLQNKGATMTIPSESLHLITAHKGEIGEKPLIELLKKERFATINDFTKSLMILGTHDTFDHFFSFDLLQRTGILERYADFFRRIGNPHATDMFGREGEMVASPVYNIRKWSMIDSQIQPDITAKRIERILEKSANPTENQQRALQILRDTVLKDPEVSRRLGYIVTGMSIELLEQRRKQGFIRDLDEDFQPQGIVPILDPEYMALIIETDNIMHSPEIAAFDALANASLLVEEYLFMLANMSQDATTPLEIPKNLQTRVQFAEGSKIPTLVIKIDDMRDETVKQESNLPKDRIQWIIDHPASTTTLDFIK